MCRDDQFRANPKGMTLDVFATPPTLTAVVPFRNSPSDTCFGLTAKKNADGSIAIQFDGCDSKIADCLPLAKGERFAECCRSRDREGDFVNQPGVH